MLFRNRFMKYHKPEPTPPGGAPAPMPEPTPTPAPQAPTFTAEQIQWMMANNMGQPKPPATPPAPAKEHQSEYDRIKAEEETNRKQAADVEAIRSQVKFELEFDGVVKSNASMFGIDADKMREGAKGLAGADLVAQLRVMAAKAFLDKPENHKIMLPDDLAFAKASIMGQADRAIDAEKAWSIVERSIQVAAIKQHSDDVRGGSKQAGALPNLAAWVQRAVDRWKRV